MSDDRARHVEFAMTVDDVRAWYHDRRGSAGFERVLVVSSLTIAILVAGASTPVDAGSWWTVFGVAICVGLLLAMVFYLNRDRRRGDRRARQILESDRARGMLEPHRVDLDDEGCALASRLYRAWWSWALVSDIRLEHRFVVIEVGGSPIAIPSRSFGDASGTDAFVAEARRLRAAAPTYERTCPSCGYRIDTSPEPGCPECGWSRSRDGPATISRP